MNRSIRAYPSRRQELHARPHRFALLLALFILLPVVMTGCADPAADAPDAVVSEVSEDHSDAPMDSTDHADARHYAIDTANSSVSFVGSKVTGSHEGGFNQFEGTISVSGGDPTTGKVDVTIDTTSLWSDDERLTGHLASEDFFAVETYPTASFSSTGIAATETGYEITGELNLHGVTKQISFPATVTVADGAVDASAEFSIKRFDFGIEYAGRADDLIRDEVLIQLNLKANASDAG